MGPGEFLGNVQRTSRLIGESMKTVSQVLGGIVLSLVVTSASADIMFSPTPSGTGNNVVFNQHPPNQTGTTIFGNINVTAGAVYEHSDLDDSVRGPSPH